MARQQNVPLPSPQNGTLPPGVQIPPGYTLVQNLPQGQVQQPGQQPGTVVINQAAPRVNWITMHPYATGIIMLCVGTALGILVYYLVDTYSGTPSKR